MPPADSQPSPIPPVAVPTPPPITPPVPVADPTPAESASRDRGRPSEADLRAEAAAWRVQHNQLRDQLAAREVELTTAREEADRREAAARNEGNTRAERFRTRFVDAELRAHASQAGIVDLDLIPLIDRSTVTVDDDGNVVGVEAAVAAFKVSKPTFFRTETPIPASSSSVPAPASTGSARPVPVPEANPAPANIRTLDKRDYDRAKRDAVVALRGHR